MTAVFGQCALEEPRLLTIAMSFGFSIFVLVYAAASFSGAFHGPARAGCWQSTHRPLTRVCCLAGGHLNPAVSIGLACGGKISVLRALLYIIAQCLGACTGAALIKAVRGRSLLLEGDLLRHWPHYVKMSVAGGSKRMACCWRGDQQPSVRHPPRCRLGSRDSADDYPGVRCLLRNRR